jgi:hypothetical protein
MSQGCDDCLRDQLGFLSEADYPLDPLLEAPERIYCIDGAPSITPHKGFVGPYIATLVVTPPTLATSGTLTGDQVDIAFVNDTARPVTLALFVTGNILFQSDSDTYTWTFTYGFDVAISSPALVLFSSMSAISNYDELQTIPLGFFVSLPVDAGGTMSLAPRIGYTVTGSGSPGQSVLHGANLSVMAFGGSA